MGRCQLLLACCWPAAGLLLRMGFDMPAAAGLLLACCWYLLLLRMGFDMPAAATLFSMPAAGLLLREVLLPPKVEDARCTARACAPHASMRKALVRSTCAPQAMINHSTLRRTIAMINHSTMRRTIAMINHSTLRRTINLKPGKAGPSVPSGQGGGRMLECEARLRQGGPETVHGLSGGPRNAGAECGRGPPRTGRRHEGGCGWAKDGPAQPHGAGLPGGP
jgi:hypothetical protein